MPTRLEVSVGRVALKNPVIAGSAEHLIDADGIRRAIAAGAGAVVVKSTNESAAARDQLQRAEYLALDERWTPVPWGPDAPRATTIACRSGLNPMPFEEWLAQTALLDREAMKADAYVVASLILADLDTLVDMVRQVEQAGVRVIEVNIGTPYATQAAKGAVSTELDPARITTIVTAVRRAGIRPIWVKISGQSERVPDLAAAAKNAGADAVVMAGRSLGLVPDIETLEPMLATTLGVGGFWNLPLTCHWLALSRAKLGRDFPLIGTNGAQDGLDVARMMLSGASAAELSSAVMMRGASLIAASLAELDGYLSRKGLTAQSLVGRAADARKTFADMPLKVDNWKRYVTP